MEMDPLNKLTHPAPSKDPAVQGREGFVAREHSQKAGKEGFTSLDKWSLMKNVEMNLKGHDVEKMNSKDEMAQGPSVVFNKTLGNPSKHRKH